MSYYDSFFQEYQSTKMDIKLKFVIKEKVVYCSKILFWLQSKLDDKMYEDEFVVEEKGATVKLVKKFVNWIESRNKNLGKLKTKEYLILEKLASTYKIRKLSNQIYGILEEMNKKSCKKINEFQYNFNFSSLDEKKKKDIINNADLYLYYDNNISFTVLRSLDYHDKVEILRREIEKGKISSLLSFLFIFKKEEILNNPLVDLAPLFQSSQKCFTLIISKIYEYLNKSDESQFVRYKNQIKNDMNQVKNDKDQLNNHEKIIQELANLQQDFKVLQDKSEKLLSDYKKSIDKYNTVQGQLGSFNEKAVKFEKDLDEQTKTLEEKWNNEYNSKYCSIIEKHNEYQKTVKKVKNASTPYFDLMKMLRSGGRNNYIISKIFTYNFSYQYVNDSFSTILQTDCAQNEKENFLKITHLFTDDQANLLIIDFNNNNQIFNPLYYKLGFCYQPSFYSWEILAKFQYIENSNNDNKDKNINNDSKDASNDNKDKGTNNDNKDKDANNNDNDKDSNNEKKQNIYNCYETKDNNNEEWVLIDFHHFDELPHQDESYDPDWDDPFILQFKFLPGLFPQAIKLHLKDIKNPDNQDQISLKKCFNYFQITGILE